MSSKLAPNKAAITTRLLVHFHDLQRVKGILTRHPFLQIPTRSGADGLLFLRYDPATARWIELQVIADSYQQQGLRRPLRKFTESLAAIRLRRRGLSVALLGPDGAGKSTLAAGIKRTFYFPVQLLYMGLWRGETSKRLGPFVNLPGYELAKRLLRAWRPYLTGLYHRARGRLVIFDRYTYDALLTLPAPSDVRSRLYYWVLAHACPAPDLVLVLDVPGEVMYRRKGEHSSGQLETQRQRFLDMSKNIPHVTVLDGTLPPDEVLNRAVAQIWLQYTSY